MELPRRIPFRGDEWAVEPTGLFHEISSGNPPSGMNERRGLKFTRTRDGAVVPAWVVKRIPFDTLTDEHLVEALRDGMSRLDRRDND